jgi:ribonuclease P/MRP protein subunit RPP40
MISGLAGRTYEDRLKELGIVTLEERRHQMDMLQTYKILSGKEKVDPSSVVFNGK